MPVDRRTIIASPLLLPAGAALAAGSAASLVAGPAQAKPKRHAAFLDVADFGILPGKGDVTEPLQRAIDGVATKGGTLHFAAGAYGVSSVSLRGGVRLVGAGPATRFEGDGLVPLFSTSGAGACGLFDMSLSMPALNSDPAVPVVGFTETDGVDLEGVTIFGGGRGLELSACSGSVRNCNIVGAAGTGLFSIDARGLRITNNAVEGCGNNGIQIWRSEIGADGTIVSANRITNIRADDGGSGQNGNGINVYRAGGVQASGNRIENCAYSALRSNSGSDCQFIGNSCTGLGEVAIYAEFNFQGAVVANNIIDDAATGISITNFNDGGRLAVVSGNLIRNLHTRDHFDARGNGIGAEADTLVSGNVIEGAALAGITLGWGRHLRNVMASNNIVRDCRWGIAASVTDGAGSAMISGNMISEASEASIQGMLFDKASGGDLVNDNGNNKWSHLNISGNLAT